MKITDLKDKKIAVLGYGMEGQAVTRWLIKNNFKPTVLDLKPLEKWDESLKKLVESEGIETITGENYLHGLDSFEVIFRSPGIWRLHPEILNAENKGVIITSQSKWFLETCQAKVIGVTGTKGKGTTCSLIFEILNNNPEKSSNVFLTGNIGKDQPFDFLDQLTEKDIVIYELSSFQLQDVISSPQISVVLMTTNDHLDIHEDLEEYHGAKENIIKFQNQNDIAIINIDFEANKKILRKAKSQVYTISEKSEVKRGVIINNEGIQTIGFEDPVFNFSVNTNDISLKGHHNLQNVAAASLVGAILKINPEIILNSIRSFKGLEHRLELVTTLDGISYYNDSISTVPDTTIAAINAFVEPIILIAGGSEKNSDYSELAEKICSSKNIKAVILIGKTGQTIKNHILKIGNFKGQLIDSSSNMKEAVKSAQAIASSGDSIVLSPGSASFDWFKNYKDRGNQFVEAI